MNSFFRKLPLPVKLMLISLIPLALIIYLALQFYVEKTQRINLLDSYLQSIEQSSDITLLIDVLQQERSSSYEFSLKKERQAEMLAQRPQTDSIVQDLQRHHDISLKDFPRYTFIDTLQDIRQRIDAGQIAPNGVMHYYTNMIFRLNTLNNAVPGNNAYLRTVNADLATQKLLSEMVTYLGIMGANVYNVLYTRQYMVETLVGTMGVYEVYNTYEKEYLLKATPEGVRQYQQIRQQPELKQTAAYLGRLFTTFKFDSTYTHQQWGAQYTAAINKLRGLQQGMLNTVEARTNAIYEEERRLKTRTLVFIVAAFAVCLFIVAYTLHVINQMLNELKAAALKISKGGTGLELRNESRDAIGSLAESILNIDKNNQYLVEAAHAIGKGNFAFPFTPRSEQDVLGYAILRMKESLQLFTKEIENREQHFRQLANSLPQLVWTAQPDGTTDYFNQQWYRFTGFQEGVGDGSWLPILHPDDVQKTLDVWYHSVKTGEPYEIEYRFKDRRTGDYRWFLGKALPLKDEEGKVVKWFGTCTDIHERKAMSEHLEALVRQRTEELRRSNEDLQQFAHIASHDLKVPLRKVRTFGSRLYDELGNGVAEKERIYLDKIMDATDRMTRMVDGVLHYSSINAENHPLEPVDLNGIVDGIKSDLEVTMQQKGATIVHDQLPQVMGVPVLLHQLFYNLVSNSLKFSKPDVSPQVHITAQRMQGKDLQPFPNLQAECLYETIKVADNGIGFNPAYAGRLFDVFARLNSYDKYEGTGLGLALCKKIALRHNGFIYADAVEGKGATFTVVLPVETGGHLFG